MNSGDIIGGRYRLDRKIGQGGTGRIWLAQDGRLDRRVAIKFLFAQNYAHQSRLAKRVALEAKIAASIQHPNVIQIFDFGTHDDNIPYIVMEALSGYTLGEAFDSKMSFSLDTMIHIMSEVLRGLSAVHDAGIVHRDLKPENIFLVKDPRGKPSPKLLDFGISRSLEPETRASAVTTTEGMILGTPQYMSPEQARGDSHIDKRTDIYSFGTIMFEAFAGVVPFPANSTAELLIAVLQRNPPPLYELAPQIGPPLCAVVDRALKKDRGKRYIHAAEMLDALTDAAHQVPFELDHLAPLFPPAAIKNRISRRADAPDPADDEPPSGARPPVATMPLTTPNTVQEPNIQRRGRRPRSDRPSAPPPPDTLPLAAAGTVSATRPPLAVSRAAWLALIAFAAFGVTLAAALTVFDRMREPEGSGLIVVQAPTPSLAAARPTPEEPAPTPPPQAAPVDPVALDERAPLATKKSAAKSRKSTPTDPMQLMATRVAEAFSKQKAGVIACLNAHASDLDGAPQLKVRLRIDANGSANNAELLPDAISNKPVAGCLKTAVMKMSFPKPDQPTTFSVPLLWRRK